MKDTITQFSFCDWFLKSAERKNQFSYHGLLALFAWYEQYEEDTGEEIELDPIGFCCEYSEYENIKEFQADYGEEYKTIKDIENETQVIPVGKKGFIIQQF